MNELDQKLDQLGQTMLNVFDHIIVVDYTCNQSQCSSTLNLLDRLGVLTPQNIISKKVMISNDMPNMVRRNYVNKILFRTNPKTEQVRKWSYILFNHYYALSLAKELKSERTLILESDCIVNKDIDVCIQLLKNIPDDADFINFNCAYSSSKRYTKDPDYIKRFLAQFKQENDPFYARLTEQGINGCCYMVSRKYINAICKVFENCIGGIQKIDVEDRILNKPELFPDCNLYLSKKCLFSQCFHQGSHSGKWIYQKFYKCYNVSENHFYRF